MQQDSLTFERTLKPAAAGGTGPSDRHYGLTAARSLGMPAGVLQEATR